ncbi:MAG TPA: hypothetical protein DIT25_00715 [Candidatus Moranbacteria bacterium]|nr:hypothetical protein [Candidatus Moranbacteria bacterium]
MDLFIKITKLKIIKFGILILLASLATYSVFIFPSRSRVLDLNLPKKITLDENGLLYESITSAKNVEEFLKEKNISLSDKDQVIPEKSAPIFPGTIISIQRAQKIKIEADGKNIEAHTFQKDVAGALAENGIRLGRLDKVSPGLSSVPDEKNIITITRINVEKKAIEEKIDFKILTETDSKMGWREEKIKREGEKGIQEIKYEITYKNGKEISRTVLEKKIIKDSVAQIVIKGTYVKTGKTHTGLGTWYAWKGGLFAASPWLPMGSYAKVTNKANGKSVIVQINDRGPFGPNRIIDLDKVAFAKIASVGAGVIDVKVEEILN